MIVLIRALFPNYWRHSPQVCKASVAIPFVPERKRKLRALSGTSESYEQKEAAYRDRSNLPLPKAGFLPCLRKRDRWRTGRKGTWLAMWLWCHHPVSHLHATWPLQAAKKIPCHKLGYCWQWQLDVTDNADVALLTSSSLSHGPCSCASPCPTQLPAFPFFILSIQIPRPLRGSPYLQDGLCLSAERLKCLPVHFLWVIFPPRVWALVKASLLFRSGEIQCGTYEPLCKTGLKLGLAPFLSYFLFSLTGPF